ncbi:BON domain-containing protein [Parachryseolinea silvisoli]|uniref:BON domain-containing protein n=1 Tax=Parachryseolinea silvisoli TaxID=2873601 RepID=UPI002265A773|nr:BON domain-containing protein [Parachryseolinea silvisoli]MCD9019386.1 BON domain-containing protein [Parachryseolinea silvisoli]
MSNYNRGQRGQRSQRPNYNREDSNRNYSSENRDYGNEYGTNWGAQQGNDYNENSWYGRSRQGDYGNTGYNTNYAQSRYGNSGDMSRNYDRDYDTDYFGNRRSYEGGSYEGGYGNRGYNDDDYNSYGRYGNQYNRGSYNNQYDRGNYSNYGSSGGYGNSNFGSGYGYGRGYDYNRGQHDQGSIGNAGSYGTIGSYGNEQYRDRGVWDKAKDEVSSWFGNEDAERRREMDRRFIAQHRGKGPRGYSRSDDRIKEDVNDRLSDNPYIDASDVEVSVSNGEVVLSGKVTDRHDKRRAEDIAEGVSGVRNVENRIRVQSEIGESTSSFTTTPRSTQTTEKSKSRNGLVES